MAFKSIDQIKESQRQKSLYETEKGQIAAAQETELITLEEEKVFREGVVSIRDLISPSAFRVESSFVQLGTIFCRTIFVVSYPRYISVGWSSPVINLSTTMDISMFFYPVKSAIILKQLKNKVGALEAQISADSEKGAPRDPVRETALRDIEQLRDDL
ncbi:MAG: conjugal transfer protein TraC, partial [Candidatus Magasanikbacteria bacterium]